MKSLSSWLLVMFMFMFWVFRVIIAFQAQYEKDFGGFVVFNYVVEVALLFVVVLCFILVLRRKLLGGILYLGAYGYYFGTYLIGNILPNLISGESLDIIVAQNALVAAMRNCSCNMCIF